VDAFMLKGKTFPLRASTSLCCMLLLLLFHFHHYVMLPENKSLILDRNLALFVVGNLVNRTCVARIKLLEANLLARQLPRYFSSPNQKKKRTLSH